MRTFFILISAWSILTITACSKKEVVVQETGVQLRIENLCGIKLDSVWVNSPGGKQVYYNVNLGEKSGYKAFSFIYPYAYIKIFSGSQSMVLQPIDYVGETKITTGMYTYRIYFMSNFTGNFLTVENIKD